MRSWMREWGRRRRTIVGALLALLLAGAGAGGYLIGSSSDIDLNAARLTAAAEGQEAGAEKGAKEGYAQGYRSARERSYGPAYSAAYRAAYSGEFESAGLDPPETIRVPEPR